MKSKYEIAKDNLRYDSESGCLYWVKTQPSGFIANSRAGNIKANGYVALKVGGHKLYAHRIAWYLHYGIESKYVIYHLDGNKSNNRISNLRENPKVLVEPSISHSFERNGQYKAFVSIDGNKVPIGVFGTAMERDRHQDSVRSALIEKAKKL